VTKEAEKAATEGEDGKDYTIKKGRKWVEIGGVKLEVKSKDQ